MAPQYQLLCHQRGKTTTENGSMTSHWDFRALLLIPASFDKVVLRTLPQGSIQGDLGFMPNCYIMLFLSVSKTHIFAAMFGGVGYLIAMCGFYGDGWPLLLQALVSFSMERT